MRRVRTTIPVRIKQKLITEQLYLLMCIDRGWILHDASDMREQCKAILRSKDSVETRFELRHWLSDKGYI